MKPLLLTGLLCVLVMTAFCGVAAAELEAGMLLVAREKIRDPRFHETVVLVLQHDQRGTVGLILNRPSRLPLAEALPDRPELAAVGTLAYGGPVAADAALALVAAGETPPAPALKITGNIYVTGVEALAGWLAAGGGAASCRVFLGHAGWAPGQLDMELSGDAWQLLPATESQPFLPPSTRQLDSLWQELRRRDQERAAP